MEDPDKTIRLNEDEPVHDPQAKTVENQGNTPDAGGLDETIQDGVPPLTLTPSSPPPPPPDAGGPV